MSRRQIHSIIAMAIVTVAVVLMLGCMTPEAADYHRRHPEYRLFRYRGRLVYPIGNDPYAVPHEIVKQMTEKEYNTWLDTLRSHK